MEDPPDGRDGQPRPDSLLPYDLWTEEALRQSQLELIGDPKTAHPFYWAAFALIGVGDTAGGGGIAQTAQQANGGTL